MIAIYISATEKQLESFLQKSDDLLERIHLSKDDYRIDIDKAFAGLFFLLTGENYEDSIRSENPLYWVLLAPQDIDSKQDLGNGPASYTTIKQTKELSLALDNISEKELILKYDPEYFNEMCIYPFDCDWDNESSDYLLWAFVKLKDFYRKASLDGNAVIQFFG